MILLCSELNEIASQYTRMLLIIKIQVIQAQNMCNILHGSKDGVYVLLMYQLLYQKAKVIHSCLGAAGMSISMLQLHKIKTCPHGSSERPHRQLLLI